MKELNQQPLQDCAIRNLVTYAHRISRGCNLVLSIEQVASATTARLRNAQSCNECTMPHCLKMLHRNYLCL